MKKIISAIAATLLISAFVGCTAADDSTISSPRLSSNIDKNSGNDNNNNNSNSKNAIEEYCSSYTKLGSEGNETAYQCSNGDYYVCTASSCEEIEVEDYME
jgi:hypothetical protein